MPWAATCCGGVIAEVVRLQQQHVAEMDAITKINREPWMPWHLSAAECVEHFKHLGPKAAIFHAKSPKPFPASEALMKIAPIDHQLGGDAAKNRIVAG